MGRVRYGGDHERFDTTDFFSVVQSSPHQPEVRLLMAVVHKAIHDYADPNSRFFLRWRAAKWLFSDSREVMSVWWICQALSEDPDWLKAKLLERAKALKRAGEKPTTVCFRVDTK